MTSIAIPNKGRLFGPTLGLLRSAGMDMDSDSRSLFTVSDGVEVLFGRAKDIPLFVKKGVVDFGITGYDVLRESTLPLKDVLDLGYGKCRLVLAGPPRYQGMPLRDGMRVATSFPYLASEFFAQKRLATDIIEVSGAVENMPKLGMSDAVVDLTSTGRTLDENGLVVLDTILDTSARLICNGTRDPGFIERLRSAL